MGIARVALLCGVLILTPFLTITSVGALPAQGEGTAANPYKISTCLDLQSMNEDLSAHYVLTENVECYESADWNDHTGFVPVGESAYSAFTGVLDGQGHTINNLYIDRSAIDENIATGVFGFIVGGTVKNLDVNGFIKGGTYVGGIAGAMLNDALITNVKSDVITWGNAAQQDEGLLFGGVGGIAGLMVGNSTITRAGAFAPVGVALVDTTVTFGGGIVGTMVGSGTVTDVMSDAHLVSLSDGQVGLGGVIGASVDPYDLGLGNGMVKNAYASSIIDLKDGNLGGGFIGGVQNLSIAHSFSTAHFTTDGEPYVVGGFYGYSNGSSTTLTDTWLDADRSQTENCAGTPGDISGCTVINTDDAPDPDRFSVPTNAPLSSWDFTHIWTISNEWPILQRTISDDTPTDNGGESDGDDDEDTPTHLPSGKGSIPFPTINKDTTPNESDKNQTDTETETDTESNEVIQPTDTTPAQTTDTGPDATFWIYVAVVGGLGAIGVIAWIIRALRLRS